MQDKILIPISIIIGCWGLATCLISVFIPELIAWDMNVFQNPRDTPIRIIYLLIAIIVWFLWRKYEHR